MSDKPKKRKRKGKGAIAQRAEFLAYRFFSSLVRRSSPSGIDRLGRGVARLSLGVMAKRRRIAVDNVLRAFPEKTEEQALEIVRASWTHFCQMTLDYVRSGKQASSEVASRIDILNIERLAPALADDRGLVMVTAHFGSWEFAVTVLESFDVEITVVARTLDNERLEREISEARTRSRVQLVDRRSAAKALVRTLTNKGWVVMLVDQAVKPKEGILAPFLGRDAWTTVAPARLSLRFGAPILIIFCVPNGERFQIELEMPLRASDLPENERTIEGLTRRINDMISARIRRNPELWFWMHNRWKGVKG